MSDNYKVIEEKLAELEEFKGNSLRGYWQGEGLQAEYRVISYNTLVATAGFPWSRNGELQAVNKWVTPEKYSVTTTKQCNIIKRAWGLK